MRELQYLNVRRWRKKDAKHAYNISQAASPCQCRTSVREFGNCGCSLAFFISEGTHSRPHEVTVYYWSISYAQNSYSLWGIKKRQNPEKSQVSDAFEWAPEWPSEGRDWGGAGRVRKKSSWRPTALCSHQMVLYCSTMEGENSVIFITSQKFGHSYSFKGFSLYVLFSTL